MKACDIHYQRYKANHKESVKVKVFNKEVTHQISVEEAKLFLEKKGWFVYKPTKGENITIKQSINF